MGLSPSALARDTPTLLLGEPQPFSFDSLKALAESMSLKPWSAPGSGPAEVLARIDYDAHRAIRFDTNRALFAQGPGQYPVIFYYLGTYFRSPVNMHVVDKGVSREIVFDESYFHKPRNSPAHQLPPGNHFAGFSFQESRFDDQRTLDWQTNSWVSFLGGSYFRAVGEQYQVGISARGIAVNVAHATQPEEFPGFTRIWFETPSDPHSRAVTVYALLDGPSVCGAYRFVLHRDEGVIMDIDASLFLRKDMDRLGIAPLTSMFWFSKTAKPTVTDWRPEVHDSDGLAIWTGSGERIWRPLNNAPRVMASAFTDNNPKGFGLLQRERNFDQYQDNVYYERRPGLWVEPQGDWGEGSVQLVEIPTDDETHDNIVAMWVPKLAARAAQKFHLRYRLHWLSDEPYPPSLARCVATRLGRGGRPGMSRPEGARKFVVEFKGGSLSKIPVGMTPLAVLSCSRGTLSDVNTEPVPDGKRDHWRANFDLSVEGKDPVELRLFLRLDDQALSETWLYQYHPFAAEPGLYSEREVSACEEGRAGDGHG
ncbi:glucan biosynthesis protein [Pseudomonas sp. DWP3-1-2]|uniref:glucan biosynthesis protein n=1 Tax=Pseudomonas sp. DWP3-1-2 TaxID=2804645 RepID=UPI003CE8DF13